ncbi:hypothetical protein [Acinetobacter pittii]|uniref:hypothetical protein n=1 Tax=Acinetobacter pittii TaxID=48296 RepID=UPI0022A9B58C|nr:hypothetical protein [Acinetobacter pittii]MCZ1176821.1 hypothetical protein [Acinetobacter pittii]
MIDFNLILKTHKKYKHLSLEEDLNIEEIKEYFNNTLLGNTLNYSYFVELRDSFLIQYNLSKQEIYKSIYENLYFIFSNFNYKNKFSSNQDSFLKAYKYCMYAKDKNLFPTPHTHISDKVKCLSESIKFFGERGINNIFSNGKINKNKLFEIEKIIDNKFKKIGAHSIPELFSRIPKLYNTQFYSFVNESDTQLYPWGYILNKALKHLSTFNLNQDIKTRRIQSVFDYSKHYISLHQYQNYKYSHFEYIYSSASSILSLIDKHVIGDQLLKIEQYDPKSIINYLKYINDKFNTPELNLTFELAVFVINSPHNKILDITNNISSIYQKYSTDITSKISNLLTHSSINLEFNTIYDLGKNNYKNKPFVKINDRILFLNHSIFFIGFYRAFVTLLLDANISYRDQGKLLESFAEHSLRSTSLHFIGSNDYKVGLQKREQLGIVAKSLEVDLVIHNKKNIAFLEIKRRELTDTSKEGNGYKILDDLAESFIKSQMQLNRHKRFLLNFNDIFFKDGQKLSHEGRNIYKVSVSSLEYQTLHSTVLSRAFLRSVPFFSLNSTSDPETNKYVKPINDIIDEFSTEILKPETSIEITDPHGLQNTYFLNIFHFLFLIDRAKTKGTDFIDELTLHDNTILNQMDFYYCYFYKDKKLNS